MLRRISTIQSNQGFTILESLLAMAFLLGSALWISSGHTQRSGFVTANHINQTWNEVFSTAQLVLQTREGCSPNLTASNITPSLIYQPTTTYQLNSLKLPGIVTPVLQENALYEGNIKITSMTLGVETDPPLTYNEDFDGSPGSEPYQLVFREFKIEGEATTGTQVGKKYSTTILLGIYLDATNSMKHCFSKYKSLNLVGTPGSVTTDPATACKMLGGYYDKNINLSEVIDGKVQFYSRCRLTSKLVVSDNLADRSLVGQGEAYIKGNLTLTENTTQYPGVLYPLMAEELTFREPTSGKVYNPCQADGSYCPAASVAHRSIRTPIQSSPIGTNPVCPKGQFVSLNEYTIDQGEKMKNYKFTSNIPGMVAPSSFQSKILIQAGTALNIKINCHAMEPPP